MEDTKTTKAVREVTMKCAWKRCRNEWTQQSQTARGFCSPKCKMAYHRFKKKWLADLEKETLPMDLTRSPDGLGVYVKLNYTPKGLGNSHRHGGGVRDRQPRKWSEKC